MGAISKPEASSDLTTLAERINAAHYDAISHAEAAVTKALEVGRLLSEAKAGVKHGEWIPWVETHCRFGARQAQKYIRAHENRAAIEEQMRTQNSLLTLDSALALIAEPASSEPVANLRQPSEMEAHEQCSIVPDMTPEEFDRLCESIAKHGFVRPIVVYKGKILDGRQRYRACRRLGVEPRFVEHVVPPSLEGRSDNEIILEHIAASNLGRRSMSSAEIAGAMARLAAYASTSTPSTPKSPRKNRTQRTSRS